MRISDWSSDVCSSDLSSRRICLWPFSIGHIALVDSRDRLRRVGIGSPTGLTGARRYSVDRPSRTTRACMVCCRCGSLGRGQHCLSGRARGDASARSEEHTSELQSLMRISYAVFCLKKKKKTDNTLNEDTIHH